jgi:hypothetical protein
MDSAHPADTFQLRYLSLYDSGRGFSFPCDAEGHVDLDGLSDRGRENYLYVRALVGRDFSPPAVVPPRPH